MAKQKQVMQTMQRKNGFSLVELSIVISIIGLLITAVIKGVQLTQQAKVVNAITLAQDLTVAVSTFKQKYHMLPGDLSITSELPNLRAECLSDGANKGNNNGQIEASESQCVPEVLFQAGLAKVDKINMAPPEAAPDYWAEFNSYYGSVKVVAVSKSHVVSNLYTPASVTHVIEFENLPCETVQEIDLKIDNDNLATGKAIAAGIIAGATCAAGSVVAYYAVAL